MTDYTTLTQNIRDFIHSPEQLCWDMAWRKKQLNSLISLIDENTTLISEALFSDLGKNEQEAWLTEIGIVRHEARYALKHIDSWAKGKSHKTPLFLFPASSHVQPQPFGLALIIAPWNYPFQLLISPLIAAISAGNACILKPSELAPETAKVIAKLIPKYLDNKAFAVVEGGPEETSQLLKEKFDVIFFTGSTHVAKYITRAAAEHLTPTILELGGKSPTVIIHCKNLKHAARRIAFAKYTNAGQTCVAPDYVLIEESLKDTFIAELKTAIKDQFGEHGERMGKIIHDRHYNRLKNMLQSTEDPTAKVICGGHTNDEKRTIEPTVIEVSTQHPLMLEEIFGPILPIITISASGNQSIASVALNQISAHPTPLACYLFSDDKSDVKPFKHLRCGGFVYNDALMHVANIHIPFGGIGTSGMGQSHGYAGFCAFSHHRSELMQSGSIDIPFRYPPYTQNIWKLMKFFMH